MRQYIDIIDLSPKVLAMHNDDGQITDEIQPATVSGKPMTRRISSVFGIYNSRAKNVEN